MPLYPSKVLRAREHAPTLCSFVVFSLEFTIESLKELGARHVVSKLDSPIGKSQWHQRSPVS
jgi:hypothetical protein